MGGLSGRWIAGVLVLAGAAALGWMQRPEARRQPVAAAPAPQATALPFGAQPTAAAPAVETTAASDSAASGPAAQSLALAQAQRDWCQSGAGHWAQKAAQQRQHVELNLAQALRPLAAGMPAQEFALYKQTMAQHAEALTATLLSTQREGQGLRLAQQTLAQQWAARLAQRGDAHSQVMALWLVARHGVPAQARVAQRQLHEQALRGRDGFAHFWASQAPCEAAACPRLPAARWREIEPDNLYAWLHAPAMDVGLSDEDWLKGALQARVAQDPVRQGHALLAAAAPSAPPAGLMQMAEDQLMGAVLMNAAPSSAGTLADVCRVPAPGLAPACLALAHKLSTTSHDFALVSVAAAVLAAAHKPTPELDAQLSLQQRWRLGRRPHTGEASQYGCLPDPQTRQERLDELAHGAWDVAARPKLGRH